MATSLLNIKLQKELPISAGTSLRQCSFGTFPVIWYSWFNMPYRSTQGSGALFFHDSMYQCVSDIQCYESNEFLPTPAEKAPTKFWVAVCSGNARYVTRNKGHTARTQEGISSPLTGLEDILHSFYLLTPTRVLYTL